MIDRKELKKLWHEEFSHMSWETFKHQSFSFDSLEAFKTAMKKREKKMKSP